MRIFLNNPPTLSVFSYYDESLSSCKKSEKSSQRFLRKTAKGQTNRQTDGRTNGQTDKGETIGPPAKSGGPKNFHRVKGQSKDHMT